MTAISDLDDQWTTEIATISDTLLQKEATYMLERYTAAVQQLASLENNEISSYTIAGRSVTRRNIGEGRSAIESLRRDLWNAVYGTYTLADMNTTTA